MKENNVLEVSGISKRFKIYSNPLNILREWAMFGKRTYHRDFWALNDVSFEVKEGEFVGIIGPNGAGKSTILRVITDVLNPTSGSYQSRGRVLSILELTGGTDKDLSGRENVIRTGQLLGFPDGYVQDRMERIKDFSELGDFFEQPLRTYSTGMKTRLSFSMFAFMDMDVLILDEVLAVGDIFFKVKCFARLAELIGQKTSILLVTHSMGVVQRYCNRVIVLNEGRKIFDGDPLEATRIYLQVRGEKRADAIKDLELDEEGEMFDQIAERPRISSQSGEEISWPADDAFRLTSIAKATGKARANLLRLAVLNDRGEPETMFKQGDHLHIYCEFQMKQDMEMPVLTAEIRDTFNLLVHAKSSIQNQTKAPSAVVRGDIIRYHQAITLGIAPGNYVFNLECIAVPGGDSLTLEKLGHNVAKGRSTRIWRLDGAFAISISPRHGEELELLHGGLCDLPGEAQMQVIPASL